MPSKAVKFYVIWKGRQPGIYTTWAEAEAQVKGFADAQHKSFPTLVEAQKAFESAYETNITRKEPGQPSVAAQSLEIPPAVLRGVAVDAACSGVPGPVEFRGVQIGTGAELFKLGPYRNGTNNIGEFLAIVHALMLLAERSETTTIYSDSRTALAWIRAKKCRTEHTWDATNRPLYDLVQAAERWLAENDYPNRVVKWETEDWGENPADFGRK